MSDNNYRIDYIDDEGIYEFKRNIDNLKESLLITQKYFNNLPELTETLISMNEKNFNAIKDMKNTFYIIREEQDALVEKSMKLINNINKDIFNTNQNIYNSFKNIYSFQINTLALSENFYTTVEINNLIKDFIKNNYLEGIDRFLKAFKKNNIEAPNLAFIKPKTLLSKYISENLPKGIPTILKQLNINTAYKLANAKEISFIKKTKKFYNEKSIDNKASIEETNILCSGLDILNELTDTEMIDFMNYMVNHLPFASQHPVGIKIRRSIQSWKTNSISNDLFYFHGRELRDGQCPYTQQELCAAPQGIAWHGRFNFPGESHYYFSDKEKGAIIEVKRHARYAERIQIVKFKPVKKLKIVDLTVKKAGSKFLDYCRFPLDTSRVDLSVRKEYLVPSYFANCCKEGSIEGIKYLGSKEYNNFVTWKDGHFNFNSSWIKRKGEEPFN